MGKGHTCPNIHMKVIQTISIIPKHFPIEIQRLRCSSSVLTETESRAFNFYFSSDLSTSFIAHTHTLWIRIQFEIFSSLLHKTKRNENDLHFWSSIFHISSHSVYCARDRIPPTAYYLLFVQVGVSAYSTIHPIHSKRWWIAPIYKIVKTITYFLCHSNAILRIVFGSASHSCWAVVIASTKLFIQCESALIK